MVHCRRQLSIRHRSHVRRSDSNSHRDARTKLRYELLEPRHLLAGDLDAGVQASAAYEQPIPTESPVGFAPTNAPITWFESFSDVPRIAVESLATVDPILAPQVAGPRPLATGEWIVQLTAEAAQHVRRLATADALLDSGYNNFTVIAGLGIDGLMLVRGQGVTQFDIESSLSTNTAVASFHQNQLITGQDNRLVEIDEDIRSASHGGTQEQEEVDFSRQSNVSVKTSSLVTEPLAPTANWFEILESGRQAEDSGASWIVRVADAAMTDTTRVSHIESLLNKNLRLDQPSLRVIRGLGTRGLVQVTSSGDAAAVDELLSNNLYVEYHEQDSQVHAVENVPNDPAYPLQWHLHNPSGYDIAAPEAWTITTGNDSTVVAVLDSGIDFTHPDLAGNTWINQAEIPADVELIDIDQNGFISFFDLNQSKNASWVVDHNSNGFIDAEDLLADARWLDGLDNDGNDFVDDLFGWDFVHDGPLPQDESGHGTHVAGVISATGNNAIGGTGIVWNSPMMVLKFLDKNNSGQVTDAILAANYINMMRREQGVDVRVINNSWVSLEGASDALYQAFQESGVLDILVVASAGNGNIFRQPNNNDEPGLAAYPASFDLENLISVTATDQQGKLVPYFNYGVSAVDLAAPGLNIYSTQLGGGYGTRSGTSFAAPQVTAAAMLAWANAPHASATEIRAAILEGTRPDPSLNGYVATAGRLDLLHALQVDTIAPRVALQAVTPIGMRGLTELDVTVSVTDEFAVNTATIGINDIEMRRAGSSDQPLQASGFNFTVDAAGKVVAITYTIAAPGGVWDVADNGEYQFFLGPDAMQDTAGNPARPNFLSPAAPLLLAPEPFSISVPAVGTLIVTDTADTLVSDSLRGAIRTANQTSGNNTILLDEGVYRLTIEGTFENFAASGDLDVRDSSGSLTIIGQGSDKTTIDAAGIDRVFEVHAGSTLVLEGVRIIGGDGGNTGGGIRNSGGDLILRDSIVSENVANFGGGIQNQGGTLTIVRSEIHDNYARLTGGGIQIDFGQATLSEVVVSENSANRFGGGIQNFDGELQINDSLIVGNNAGAGGSGSGGGIDTLSTLTLIDSEVRSNTVLVDSSVAEQEPKNSIATAQDLDNSKWSLAADTDVGPTAESIPHVTIQGSGDGTFDYYKFTIDQAGDRGIFDIDFASGGEGSFDTEIFLFRQSGEFLVSNDDSSASSGGLGSTSDLDSFIDYTFDAPGVYVIAVGKFNSSGATNGISGNAPATGDLYTLQVSVSGKNSYAYGGGIYIGSQGQIDTIARIEGSIISDNSATAGGGIFNDAGGKLSITDSTISRNSAVTLEQVGLLDTDQYTAGGGLYVGDDVTILRSEFLSNNAGVGGGIDIAARDTVTVTITQSTIAENVAKSDEYAGGGGIRNGNPGEGGARLVIDQSTIRNNLSTFEGGGLVNSGDLLITDSTVSDNLAGNAGGIGNWGVARIENSTVSGNRASAEFDPVEIPSLFLFYRTGDGGGIYNSAIVVFPFISFGADAEMTIVNSTITDNIADRSGGGLYVAGPDTYAANSIFADNFGRNISTSRRDDVTVGSHLTDLFGNPLGGRLISNGNNILEAEHVASGGNVQLHAEDQVGVAAGLGPLQDNGGPTWTHLPLPGSNAIDRGTPGLQTPDQRGIERPHDGNRDGTIAADVGAVERYFGRVSGIVFNDRDADGLRNGAESGLSNWIVYLDLNDDGQHNDLEPTATTDENGRYAFHRLMPRQYIVRQQIPRLWEQTFPQSPDLAHRVMVGIGQEIEGLDFGNHADTGEIRGQVYNDLDGRGVKNSGEAGVPNWKLFLDLNADGQHDEDTEPVTLTDANGSFAFANVPPGQYTVEQELQIGWLRTAPLAFDSLSADFTHADGSTPSSDGFNAGPDWRLVDIGSGDSQHSAPHVYHFGIDTADGRKYLANVNDRLVTPTIDLTFLSGTIVLEFNDRLEIGEQEIANIIVIQGSEEFLLTDSMRDGGLANHDGFESTRLDVSRFAGNKIQVAFEVRSVAHELRTETIVADLTAEENYFVKIESLNGQPVAGYDLRINASGAPPDRFETNDSFAEATDFGTIDVLSERNLSIHPLTPSTSSPDFYQFIPASSGVLRAEIDFDTSFGDLDLYLYNSDQEIVSASLSVTDNENVAAAVNQGEIYYLEVRGFRGATHPAYDLVIDAAGISADRFENNNTLAEATSLGTVIDILESGLSIEPADVDWFEFTVTQSGDTEIHILFDHSLGDVDLRLYDQGGGLIASSVSETDIERINLNATAGQTYFIEILGFSGNANPNYDLRIDSPGIAIDRFEDNDDFATAANLGELGFRQLSELTLDSGDDVDVFRFTAFETGPAEIQLQYVAADHDAVVTLYDSNGELVATSRGAGWLIDDVRIHSLGRHEFEVVAGVAREQVDFGNQLTQIGGGAGQDGAISGIVFEDLNFNRIQDANEPSIVGLDVFIDFDRNGMQNDNEPIETTDENGYRFAGLGPGLYDVVLMGPVSGVQTWPVRSELSVTENHGTGGSPQSVALAYLNDDDMLDLAVANEETGTISIFLSDGGVGFLPRLDIPTGSGPFSIVSGNFSGDSRVDLAVANRFSSHITILENRDGGFSVAASQNIEVGDGPIDIVATNFDNDERLDLFVALTGGRPGTTGSVAILRGGEQGFTKTNLSVGGYPISLAAGRFNAGSSLDLAIADLGVGATEGTISIYSNESGVFTLEQTFNAGRLLSITAGDFDGNQTDDLAAGDLNGGVTFFSQQSDGDFTASASDFSAGATSLATGDFDRDGNLDLAVSTIKPQSNGALILRNERGSFEPQQIIGVGEFETVLAYSVTSAIPGGSQGPQRSQGPSLAIVKADTNQVVLLGNQLAVAPHFVRVASSQEQLGVNFGFASAFLQIALSNRSVEENSPNFIGTLAVADVDGVDRTNHTFALVAGEGDSNNHQFEFDGRNLQIKSGTAIDYEANHQYSVRIRATDVNGVVLESAFVIQVVDVNEPPTVTLNPRLMGIMDHVVLATRTEVALVRVDDDALGEAILSLSGDDADLFEIENGALYLKAGANLAAAINPLLQVTISVDDPSIGTTPDDSASFSLPVLGLLLEGSGQQSLQIEGLVKANPVGAALQFAVESLHPSVIADVEVNHTGDLTSATLNFTPVGDANGHAVLMLMITDSSDDSAPSITTYRSLTVTVTPVNDPPLFTLMTNPNQTVVQDGGPQTVNNFVSSFLPGGGSDETAQTVSDYIVTVDRPEIFAVLPDITNVGLLTFAPVFDRSGTAVVSVRVRDSGGRANGGNDLSPAQTFTIVVNRVPDTTPPTPVITTPGINSLTNATTFDVQVDFGEPITGFTLSDVMATSGTNSAFVDDGGGKFTFKHTGTDGSVTLGIAANVANDLSDNANLAAVNVTRTIDSTPARPVLAAAGVTSPTNAVSFVMSIAFGEAVTGFTASDLAVVGGTISTLVPDVSAPGKYTATITTSGSGTLTVLVPGGAATDAAGNETLAAVPFVVTVDRGRPTVQLSTDQAVTTNQTSFDVIAEFAEHVTVILASHVTISGGTIATPVLLANGHYRLPVTANPSVGGAPVPISIRIDADKVSDDAGNLNTASNTITITVDSSALVAVLSPAIASFVNIPSQTLTVSFGKPVTGFTQTDISVANATVSNFTPGNPATGTFSFTVSAINDGLVTVSLNAGVASDAAGNANDASNVLQWTVDRKPPQPTMNATAAALSNMTTFVLSVDFDENVFGFDVTDIAVTGATLSNFAQVTPRRYTATATTPPNGGNVTFNVAANKSTDTAGNANTAATSLSLVVDTAVPTPMLTAVSTPVMSNAVTIPVSLDFGKEVTGFNASDLLVLNATVSGFATVNATAGTYSFVLNRVNDGAVSVLVPAGAGVDKAGNLSRASQLLTRTIDTSRPSVVLTTNVPELTNASTFEVVATFSETLVADPVVADFVVVGATASAPVKLADGRYAITLSGASGSVTVDFAAGRVTDNAGNSNTVANRLNVTVDSSSLVPVLSPTTSPQLNTLTFPVTVVFGQQVVGFTPAKVTVLGTSAQGNSVLTGTISNFVEADLSGGRYTFDVTASGDGTISVFVPLGVVENLAGSDNVVSNTLIRVIDRVAPSPVITFPFSGSTNVTTFDTEIDFDAAIDPSTFVLGDLVASGVTLSNLRSVGVGRYLVTAVAADGTATISMPAGAVSDLAGNMSLAATPVSVVVDTIAATASLSATPTPAISSATVISVAVDFGEAVSGFTLSDLTVLNGTALNLVTIDAATGKFSVVVTPTEDGLVSVQVVGAAARDTAGNFTEASQALIRTVDRTPPTPMLSTNQPPRTNRSVFDVNVDFAEAVTEPRRSSLVVSGGTASEPIILSDQRYVFTITATSGPVEISFAADSVTDVAGNANAVSNTISLVVDTAALVPDIDSTSASVITSDSFDLSINFGKAVTNFDASDVVVSGASIGEFTPVELATGRYTATISATVDGLVTVSIPAGAAVDTAGNSSESSNVITRRFDRSRPVPTISGATSSIRGQFEISVSFTEAITGLTANDFQVGNAVLSGLTGSGNEYTATLRAIIEGDVTISLPEERVIDAAGNRNVDSNVLTLANRVVESIVLEGSDETVDMTMHDETELLTVKIIDIRGTGNNRLVLDAGRIAQLTPGASLLVIADAGDDISFGAGWTFASATVVDGQFERVFRSGGASVRVVGPMTWTNPDKRGDVDGNGNVTAGDALDILRSLDQPELRNPQGFLVDPATISAELFRFVDVNEDGRATAGDALFVINLLLLETQPVGGELIPFSEARGKVTAERDSRNMDVPALASTAVTISVSTDMTGHTLQRGVQVMIPTQDEPTEPEAASLDRILESTWDWIE